MGTGYHAQTLRVIPSIDIPLVVGGRFTVGPANEISCSFVCIQRASTQAFTFSSVFVDKIAICVGFVAGVCCDLHWRANSRAPLITLGVYEGKLNTWTGSDTLVSIFTQEIDPYSESAGLVRAKSLGQGFRALVVLV